MYRRTQSDSTILSRECNPYAPHDRQLGLHLASNLIDPVQYVNNSGSSSYNKSMPISLHANNKLNNPTLKPETMCQSKSVYFQTCSHTILVVVPCATPPLRIDATGNTVPSTHEDWRSQRVHQPGNVAERNDTQFCPTCRLDLHRALAIAATMTQGKSEQAGSKK